MNTIIELASIAENYNIKNSNRLRDDIVTEYTDILESLDSIDKTVINKDISLVPIYNTNEGYAIDLSSLKYVVESEKCTLEEAAQKIKDINYIGDTYPLYCIFPENINEQITVQEFCDLVEYLNENGIYTGWSSELSSDEFITEAGRISALVDKLKDKIKNMNISNINKNIADIEKKNKMLEEELAKVNKMSKEEGDKYAKKQSVKNIAILSAYSAGYFGTAGATIGGVSASVIVFKPLLGTILLTFLLASENIVANKVGSKLQDKKIDIIGFNKQKYISCIKTTIECNKIAIKELKNSLESKK